MGAESMPAGLPADSLDGLTAAFSQIPWHFSEVIGAKIRFSVKEKRFDHPRPAFKRRLLATVASVKEARFIGLKTRIFYNFYRSRQLVFFKPVSTGFFYASRAA
jgi:hypothetical protein